jgi:hypothetical protein
LNPFAPRLSQEGLNNEGNFDTRNLNGIFNALEFAYAVKDTGIYGQLLGENFSFIYRDYESGVDVIWARDTEMFTTSGLFRNTEILDLRWNSIVFQTTDSLNLSAQVVRSFRLRLAFSASDVIEVTGNANLSFTRRDSSESWKVLRWRDESNF